MARHQPMNDADASYELSDRLEESETGELQDVEVVDADAPANVGPLMRRQDGPAAPDPVEITKQIADADFEGLIGDTDEREAARQKARTLADRLTFDDVKRPAPTRRPAPSAREAAPRGSGLGRWFRRLLGRR